ncbi:hypothetical protein TNCV_4132971 [Trichonephila clavipes]|nr:hypothetical protein TNCV_4132971 [Trichonephila clavipes]
MFGCVLGYDMRIVDFHPPPFEKFLYAPIPSVVGVAVTPKCLGGPSVDLDRHVMPTPDSHPATSSNRRI